MPRERERLLELALESLLNKKTEIQAEIDEITRELNRGRRKKAAPAAVGRPRKKPRFSKEERLRRAKRMKEYWQNWRKQKKTEK
jgi:hypothetical protein